MSIANLNLQNSYSVQNNTKQNPIKSYAKFNNHLLNNTMQDQVSFSRVVPIPEPIAIMIQIGTIGFKAADISKKEKFWNAICKELNKHNNEGATNAMYGMATVPQYADDVLFDWMKLKHNTLGHYVYLDKNDEHSKIAAKSIIKSSLTNPTDLSVKQELRWLESDIEPDNVMGRAIDVFHKLPDSSYKKIKKNLIKDLYHENVRANKTLYPTYYFHSILLPKQELDPDIYGKLITKIIKDYLKNEHNAYKKNLVIDDIEKSRYKHLL